MIIGPPANSLAEQISDLYSRVKDFRKGKQFAKYLNFCAKFKSYAMFNCMLIYLQRPSANYVLTAREWSRKFNRIIKTDARPIIALQPCGPVMLLYDVSDTLPLPQKKDYDLFGEIPEASHDEEWFMEPFKQTENSSVDPKIYETIVANLPYHGVSFSHFLAGSRYGGKLQIGGMGDEDLVVKWKFKGNTLSIKEPPVYTLKTNSSFNREQNFSTIIHELGHMFCHHLPGRFETNWYLRDNLSHEQMEFEAETVDWLVCQRHGVKPNSELYLATYSKSDEDIPEININEITNAVENIEKMFRPLNIRDGLLYRTIPSFQEDVKALEEQSTF